MKTRIRPLVICFAALAGALAAQTSSVRIEQTVEPQFPAALAFTSINHGEVNVIICVDADGHLADLLVSGYTDRAFADEAVDALKHWRYTPAYDHGRPIGVRMELRFDFSATGRVVSLLAIDTLKNLYDQTMGGPLMVNRVCPPHELDHPVVPVAPVSPGNPGKLAGAASGPRSVVVDFYVDENGQPRMPVAVKYPHEALAVAAVDALSRWRFTTPTRAGKPVAVRVQQEFIFPASS